MSNAAANAVVACLYAAILSPLVFRLWPWDIRGRRKTVTLKRGRRPWE